MATRKTAPLPINPDILVWARKRYGLSAGRVAEQLHVSPDRISEWESGQSSPTPHQGRLLAKVYDRPFLEFFASAEPEVPDIELVPDFRFFSKGPSDTERRSLKGIQIWAEEQRLNALSLIEEIGDQPPVLTDNLKFGIDDDVEDAGTIVRDAIGFSIQDQLDMPASKRSQLPGILRDKIEGMGVLALKESGLTKLRARGMCLFARPLPIIVFGNEEPTAQAFTIVHEFGHVLHGASAISGNPRFGAQKLSDQKAIEGWCNRFAASLLIPSQALEEIEKKPPQPDQSISLSMLADLAKVFSVSRHAMVIRLVNLGYVAPEFYWKRMRPVFLEEEENYKGFGKSPYYGKRYVNSRGIFYTGLVLEAWNMGVITAHNAAEYMGIKNISHLQEIKTHFNA